MTLAGFLDTSMVVRYLTDDSPELAELAARIIDRQDGLLMTDVVVAETAYVLTSVYRLPRDVVVDSLVSFLQKRNITTFGIDKDYVLQALFLCRPSGRISFADAMIWAAARSSHSNVVYSLDARFPEHGIEVRRE